MTKEQLLEIDEAANNFARSKKYDLARYVGEFKGKRTYILEYNTQRETYGGLPQFIYPNFGLKLTFNYISTDDKMDIIVYLALQDQH